MNINPSIVIASVFGLFILYIICRIFIKPIKWILKLLLSCVIGCAFMICLNLVLFRFGLRFYINPLTALISGVLGLPGMAMTLLLQILL